MIKTIAAAFAVFALSGVPVASADSNELVDFLTDVRSAGLTVSPENESEALALGLGVCVDLYNGFTVTDEYQQMVEVGFTPEQAQGFLAAVVTDLCPNAVAGSVQ